MVTKPTGLALVAVLVLGVAAQVAADHGLRRPTNELPISQERTPTRKAEGLHSGALAP